LTESSVTKYSDGESVTTAWQQDEGASGFKRTTEQMREARGKWNAKHPDAVRRYRANQEHKDSADSLPSAVNWGKPWTDHDIDVVLRNDLSAIEKALLLGRTVRAVHNRRALLVAAVLTEATR